MDVGGLLTDERAVAPVVATVLMVAITVVVAALVGGVVLGVGERVDSAPQTSFAFDFDASATEVDVRHRGGDRIEVGGNANRVLVTSSAGPSATWIGGGSGNQTIAVTDTMENVDYGASGATVRVVWEDVDNESSATLAQEEAPE
jgi:flagellin-like protein